MIGGLILTDRKDKLCSIAFLNGDLETHSVETNNQILELIEEKNPDFLAVNVSDETSLKEFTKKEEELKEEGFIFQPTSHEKEKVKRFEALKAQCRQELGEECPEFIRFEPQITAEELAIHSDSAFESLGVDSSDIGSSGEFDAALGAVTARFFSQNQYRDLGIIVPESLEEE